MKGSFTVFIGELFILAEWCQTETSAAIWNFQPLKLETGHCTPESPVLGCSYPTFCGLKPCSLWELGIGVSQPVLADDLGHQELNCVY